MKRLHFLTFLAFALFPGPKSTAATLDIVVDGRGWGTASAKEVHAIALAAGEEIARHCPRTRIGPIVVHHRDDHPQTAWERTPEGKIIVGIAARDRQCAQIAFQFAHEFCHVLAMWANAERGTRNAERWQRDLRAHWSGRRGGQKSRRSKSLARGKLCRGRVALCPACDGPIVAALRAIPQLAHLCARVCRLRGGKDAHLRGRTREFCPLVPAERTRDAAQPDASREQFHRRHGTPALCSKPSRARGKPSLS